MLLDGHAKAEVLPHDAGAILARYSAALARGAVELQRRSDLLVSDMLGLVVVAEQEVAGVYAAAQVVPALIESAPPQSVAGLRTFLERPLPAPTHLRTVVWTPGGIALLRIDVVPVAQLGASS